MSVHVHGRINGGGSIGMVNRELLARRTAAVAGAVYVGAWLVGLAIAPSSPDIFAPAAEVYASFAAHREAAVVQSLFVHGVAGVALCVWTVAAYRCIGTSDTGISVDPGTNVAGRTGWTGRVECARWGGLLASGLSLVQVALQLWAVHQLDLGSVGGVDDAFDTISRVDSAKLLALAVLVGGYSGAAVQASGRPRAMAGAGALTAVLLAVSAMSFLFEVTLLALFLYASLPLLLIWAGAMTVVLTRHGNSGRS